MFLQIKTGNLLQMPSQRDAHAVTEVTARIQKVPEQT
jgi:hypothetical protein